jgi:hypothetical protein
MCLTLWEWVFREADQRVGQWVGCLATKVVKLLMKLYQTGPKCMSKFHFQWVILKHLLGGTPSWSFAVCEYDYETACMSVPNDELIHHCKSPDCWAPLDTGCVQRYVGWKLLNIQQIYCPYESGCLAKKKPKPQINAGVFWANKLLHFVFHRKFFLKELMLTMICHHSASFSSSILQVEGSSIYESEIPVSKLCLHNAWLQDYLHKNCAKWLTVHHCKLRP